MPFIFRKTAIFKGNTVTKDQASMFFSPRACNKLLFLSHAEMFKFVEGLSILITILV